MRRNGATLAANVAAASLLLIGGAHAQSESVLIFDEDDPVGVDYRDASFGTFDGGDLLRLGGPAGDKLPIEVTRAFSGQSSGLVEWQHRAGGSWRLDVNLEGGTVVDLSGFDSLIVYVNGPDTVAGGELPRLALLDSNGAVSTTVWISTLRNVDVDASASGFTPTSATNIILSTNYLNTLPAEERRLGYPSNLVVSFSDVPLDTSKAAIGAPAIPAHFVITGEDSNLQFDFTFRDLNGDSTLSAVGEFVDVLMHEDDAGGRLRSTWRIEVASAPTPTVVPAEGDVYRLALSFGEFQLDGDVDSWQRVSLPLLDLLGDESTFSAADVAGLRLVNGGTNAGERIIWFDNVNAVKNDDDSFIDEVQRLAFNYFWQEANPSNGLIKDRSTSGSACSIAAVGFGLSAYTVGIDRGWITREQGVDRTLTTLRFFWQAPQSAAVNATGYKGFFYHFLDMTTGRRRGTTELSTVDTALLLGGILHAREYFDRSDAEEREIRALADSIYERVDWVWAQARPPAISHGWRPESGFIAFDWIGYNEAMIVYLLALGSPTHPVEQSAWTRWTSGYDSDWQTHFGITFLSFPPLFGHQYSHVWYDFRDIQDAYMRGKGIDYFENSRRATLAQREYHRANPMDWPNYSRDEWGLTASDIPGGYRARGAPPAQNDDGTLAPTAPGGSVAFTPEESIAALRTMKRSYPGLWGPYGFRDAYNVSQNWIASDYLGIDQGPILLMAENYRTEAVWEVFMRNAAVQRGLERAGFEPSATGVESEHPERSEILGNFPNPFRRQTEIQYRTERPGPVRLAIYDVLGRRLTILVDEIQSPDLHSRTFVGSNLAAGIYFYSLTTPSGTVVGRMVHAH